jgi:hypothetical protein
MSVKVRYSAQTTTYTFADITEPGHDGNLTSEHNISGTLDTIHKGLAASIVIVKLGLCDRVIDVDSWYLELAILECLVQVVDTCCGLLRQALDIWHYL